MKKFASGVFILFLFFFIFAGSAFAASLKFDKTSASVNTGDTFEIQMLVDAGSDQIISADAYVTYDASMLEEESVTNGSFFPSVVPQISSGSIYVAGMVNDTSSSKTGSGMLATVKFKALKDGNTDIKYNCESTTTGPSKIIKNDLNATNIISCSENSRVTITVGSTSTTLTPTPASDYHAYTSTTPAPSTLPKTGVFDNVVKLAVPGTILLFLGVVVKFLL